MPVKWGGKGGITKGHKNIFRMMDVIVIVVIVSQVYTYIKIYQTVHFKYVQFDVYQLHLNKGVEMFLKTHLTWFNHERTKISKLIRIRSHPIPAAPVMPQIQFSKFNNTFRCLEYIKCSEAQIHFFLDFTTVL